MWTRMTGSTFFNGSVNSKCANLPTPGHMPGICHLVGAVGGEFVRKPLPGGEAFVNSSRSG